MYRPHQHQSFAYRNNRLPRSAALAGSLAVLGYAAGCASQGGNIPSIADSHTTDGASDNGQIASPHITVDGPPVNANVHVDPANAAPVTSDSILTDLRAHVNGLANEVGTLRGDLARLQASTAGVDSSSYAALQVKVDALEGVGQQQRDQYEALSGQLATVRESNATGREFFNTLQGEVRQYRAQQQDQGRTLEGLRSVLHGIAGDGSARDALVRQADLAGYAPASHAHTGFASETHSHADLATTGSVNAVEGSVATLAGQVATINSGSYATTADVSAVQNAVNTAEKSLDERLSAIEGKEAAAQEAESQPGAFRQGFTAVIGYGSDTWHAHPHLVDASIGAYLALAVVAYKLTEPVPGGRSQTGQRVAAVAFAPVYGGYRLGALAVGKARELGSSAWQRMRRNRVETRPSEKPSQ
ncbi:hypothetical protein HY490_05110 [Candidatus Woesearchaeota archaeon]|nr:hypothetical protein [Candidatus Woesearchaeota archaeon]